MTTPQGSRRRPARAMRGASRAMVLTALLAGCGTAQPTPSAPSVPTPAAVPSDTPSPAPTPTPIPEVEVPMAVVTGYTGVRAAITLEEVESLMRSDS
ncbi:MAG TPA: hypothetical protein VGA26_05065, partial [Candidatus Limnocylindria bacterium]